MVVQHNLTAMNANRMLNLTVKGQAKSTEKLSSGYKINRAADDAAGLSISEKMRKQIRGLTQASLNAQDGISMVQTAEGALNEVQDMLQRMNELSVKASNGTLSHDDRNYIQNEVDQLVSELNRVSETTKFNETYLLKGKYRLDDPKDFVGLIPDDVISEEIDAQIITRSPAQIRELKTHYMNNGVYGSDVAPATNQTKNTTMNPGTVGFMDFSGLTGNDVMRLVGTGYSVTCSQCSIFMSVMFVDDTNPAEWLPNQVELSPRPATVSAGAMKNFTDYGYITYGNSAGGMNMYVDISKCGTGKDVVDAVMNAYARYNSLNTKGYEEGCGYGMGGNHHVCIASQGGKIAVFDSWSAQGSDYDPDEAQAAVDGGTTYRASGAFQRGVLGNGRQDVEIENDKVRLHVGADATANNGIEVELGNVSDVGLGLRDHIYNWKTGRNEWVLRTDMRTQESARSSIAYISEAIQKVSTMRSRFGAIQNRLEHTINNLDNVVENTTAAESQIRDTDMATEMVRNSNNNVLAQAGQAMLAQSNQSNQGVLSLLG